MARDKTIRLSTARRAGPLLVTIAALAWSMPGSAQAQGDSKRPAGGSSNSCQSNVRLAYRAADAASAPPLRPDRAVCVRLRAGQSAYFRVASEAGSHYAIRTRRLEGDTDTVIAVLDGQGRPVMEDDDGGPEPLASLVEVGPEARAALIRIGTLESAGGSFEVVLARQAPPPPVDFPLSLQDARGQLLEAGATRRIELRRHQSAYFALPEARDNLVVATRNLRDGTDTVLTVVDAEGRTLAEDDDGGDGFASELPLNGLPAGTLFLRASTLDGAAGAFDVEMRQEAPRSPPDFPTSIEAARARGPLAADAHLPIVLRRREVAIFALPEGQDVIVQTRNLARDTDTELALLDADGQVLAEDDDGGGGFASRVSTRSLRGRAAFLRARTLDGRPGQFDLALRPLGGQGTSPGGTKDGLAGSIEEARQQPAPPVGEAIPVVLEEGQAAIWPLPEAPSPLIAMTFDLGAGVDTVLELLDADGTVLDTNDDVSSGLSSLLEIGASPRPAFLRARQLNDAAGEFQLVLIRPAR
ncbi:bacterial pre-peptidase domain protein [Acetobacteraceae bacterium AT-5844]|nr:bacterial pre-peptidase domain protein [Acetobacteraceae bacterium AT-5844]